jgi:hypothetical protein
VCADGGPIVSPLETVDTDALGDGTSHAVVSLPPHHVLDGQHYIEVRDGGAEPRPRILCGDVPRRELGSEK